MSKRIKTGYGLLDYYEWRDGTVVIDKLLIYPEFRNRGYGTHMLKTFINEHKDCKMNLSACDRFGSELDRLILFYENLGFKRTHIIDHMGSVFMTYNYE